MSKKSLNILLFEDNEADVFIVREALKTIDQPTQLQVVENGLEGAAYLKREGKYQDAERPEVIILDLNMPKKSGGQVLKEIKSDPALKHIFVAVLSNSQSPEDREMCERYTSCRYFKKPDTFPQTIELINQIFNDVAKRKGSEQ